MGARSTQGSAQRKADTAFEQKIELDGHSLKVHEIYELSQTALNPQSKIKITFAPKAEKKIKAASNFVQKLAEDSKATYGINTGFGKFSEVKIPAKDIEELQRNLILSHATGVGEELPRDIVLSMWLIRLNTIARGNSGVRFETLESIIEALGHGLLAEIPSRGSVGASGDLCPSAHAVLPYLGEGFVTAPRNTKFERIPSKLAFTHFHLKPLRLGPKEGLSLINGTQLTTALALKVCMEAKKLLAAANTAAAMMIEGMRASHSIFDPHILEARNHPSIMFCGKQISRLLSGPSEIRHSHAKCTKVQDPYSLRCAPQVHGCVLDELTQSEVTLEREINSSTDNPLIFPEDSLSLSGGNFHALFTARVSDKLATALTNLASISERRIALAMNQTTSELPMFLIKKGGLNSGFAMLHVTAAALLSEMKSLCYPASVDSIPTWADKEDHVSMGPGAGFKALKICENLKSILAIELLCAAQALDLLRPLKSTLAVERLHSLIRKHISFAESDRVYSQDIATMQTLIEENVFS